MGVIPRYNNLPRARSSASHANLPGAGKPSMTGAAGRNELNEDRRRDSVCNIYVLNG
jgi:trehalose/maltose hydrolase-like predicted phosphorylase